MDESTGVARRLEASRKSGVLNLRGEGLETVPKAAYDKNAGKAFGNWWEAAEITQIVLAHNEISTLPEAMFDLPAVVVLNLSYNQLEEIPEDICRMEELKSLDVSHNKLEHLPAAVSKLARLAQLSCSHNDLTTLPADLGLNQGNLARLDISNNKLVGLPDGLSEASSLTGLIADYNKIATITSQLARGLSHLVELSLGNNRLTGCLCPEIGAMANLKILNIRNNEIDELPPAMSGLVNLAELHAGHNRISKIADELGELKNLKVLDLASNALITFPAGPCKLELNILDLSSNELSSLPPELGSMTTLRKLPLDGNPLRTIRRELTTGPLPKLLETLRLKLMPEPLQTQKSGTRSGNVLGANENNLAEEFAKSLKLSNKSADVVLKNSGLSEIPADIWEVIGNLKGLDVSENKLSNFPAEKLIGADQLRKLFLQKSGITSWPLPLTANALPCLLELNINRNRISSIPNNAFLACAQSLRELDMSGVAAVGKIQPGCLSPLKNLQRVLLPMTTLAEFPVDLLSLTNLDVIDLSSNSISEVPEDVTKLVKLSELNLSNNNLTQLPPRMGFMQSTLKRMMLEGNLLKSIRRPILNKGTEAVLKYLADKVPT